MPAVCEVVNIDGTDRHERTARIAHGNRLGMADAFVLEAALSRGAVRLYTTDSDFENYQSYIETALL